jgi:hypothetical protein
VIEGKSARYLLQSGFFLDIENEGDIFLRNVGSLSAELHGFISKNIQALLTTAVKTSNPLYNITRFLILIKIKFCKLHSA